MAITKVRALIIDDSSVMRKIVDRSLRQAGIDLAEVREAANGVEALTVLKDNRVDLILCDINMPVMDGLEFLRQLANRRSRQRRARGDDYHRRQRVSCRASPVDWSPGLYTKAVYSATGKGTCSPASRKQQMKTANQAAQLNGIPEEWQPLLELAMREVFEIMLGCKLQAQTPVTRATAEITAMVGLAGQLCGLLTLRCSTQSAVLMAGKMLGGDISQDDEQMWDAIGEIANMVAGNFKNKLTGIADHCMLSIPTMITGSNYSCHSMADTDSLEVTLLFEGTPITVAIEIHT